MVQGSSLVSKEIVWSSVWLVEMDDFCKSKFCYFLTEFQQKKEKERMEDFGWEILWRDHRVSLE